MLQCNGDIRVEVHDWDDFRLWLSSCVDRELWSPNTCPRTGDFVAVCGRVAFDRPTWTAATKLPGGCGLASKAVYQLYEADGIRGLGGLNGNLTVHLYEPARRRLSLIADRTGTDLPLGPADSRHGPVYSSHPDAVATALDVADQWDKVSIAEFLLNQSVFTKMVLRRCSGAICRVHDTNTGARVGAPATIVAINRYRIALRRAVERRRRTTASEESWPNWTYYLQDSHQISDCFAALGGFKGSVLVLRLLTAKLWIAAPSASGIRS